MTVSQATLWGFPGGTSGKESNVRDAGDGSSIPGSGRSPGGGHGNSLQYSYLQNPMDRGSLEGYTPWDCKELDMTERLSTHTVYVLILTRPPLYSHSII